MSLLDIYINQILLLAEAGRPRLARALLRTLPRAFELPAIGRLVIVHEAGRTGGVGTDIGAEIQKRCFLKLEAPVKLVTGWE